ncbi:MAG: hypothetical protein ABWX67_12235 [Allosphingosinicella sp.]
MSGFARLLASRILSAASFLLPARLSGWSRAMANELSEIGDDRAALLFAFGCLRAAAMLAIGARLRALRALLFPTSPSPGSLPAMTRILLQPRLLGLLCAAIAVAAGIAYMQAAGAPPRYLLVNLAALVLGATAWLALGRTAASRLSGAGAATLALSVPLLLTAGFGIAVEGASRWVSVGPLVLQVSLILLPVMLILYARRPDRAGTAGMIAAATALALQPDRAMAAVLAVGLVAVAIESRGRLPILAAAASILAFGWTLLMPDTLAATAYVDRILYTAFDVGPLVGAAILAGAAALLVPALAGLAKGPGDRAALLAFGGGWSTMLAAAALGNYPTPLVGYGGSAVLGYLLSVALLPGGAGETRRRARASSPVGDSGSDPAISDLRVARPA